MHIDAPEFYAKDRTEWRSWLEIHHKTDKNVWLVYTKKSAGGLLSMDDIVEEALCYGWIDSVAGKVDDDTTKLYISKRKPTSVWSKINKERVSRLTKAGKMRSAGLAAISTAQQNGSWSAIDDVENMIMPDDLRVALSANKAARDNYQAFPRGSQKIILQWISSAKRPETRQNRISEAVALAAQNIRANHFRQPKG